MNCGQDKASWLSDAEQPNGSVFAFLDESYDPFVAAAAVLLEASDVHRMDSEVAAAFDQVQSWYHLGGMPSFEDFRRRGFHATSDPLEVRVAFVAFLAEALNFKSMIVYSDRSLRTELSDKRRLLVVFDQLIRDVLRAYWSRPKITLYFESAQAMDKYVERLAARAVQSLGRKAPEVEICFGTKRNPDLLAVPDYVLHIFNQWSSTQGQNLSLEPKDHQSRSFKAILGSVSMARSLDHDHVVRRTL